MDRRIQRVLFRLLAPSLVLLLVACFFVSAGPLAAKTTPSHKTAKSAEDDVAIIPFSYDPVNLPWIVVQVRINDNPPLPFIVDTGSWDPLVIDTPVARKLHLNNERTLSSGSASFKIVGLKSLTILGTDTDNEADFDQPEALVEDIPQFLRDARLKTGDPGIAGIIGCPVLSEAIKYVEIDFSKKRLIAHPHPPKDIPADAIVVSLHKVRGMDRYLVPVKAGSQTAQFAIDTGGAENALVPPTFATPAESLGSTKAVQLVYYGYLIACDYFQMPELKIGDAALHNLYVGLAPSSAPSAIPPPSLGFEALNHFHIWLDFEHNKMALTPLSSEPQTDFETPASQYSPPNPTFGAEFVRPPGSVLSASYVMPGCISAKAGLIQGDEIVKIRGKDSASMTADEMSNLLNQPSVDITVRRKHGTATQDIEIKIGQP